MTSGTLDPLIGTQLGGYRIEVLIGSGGMSRVYRAEQLTLGRPVAVKVLAPGLTNDANYRERFLRESRLAASIEHPNILPIYDAGESAGYLYIAMRLVNGTDLRRLLEREGPMDPPRALSFLTQAALALDAAHARGLIHRDVKPANLLLEGQQLFLTDFGVAKAAADPGVTRVGIFVGTIDYASPEQLRQEQLDARSDLYSLACVFYQCLAGTAPFDRPTDHAIIQAHLSEPVASVRERVPGLPSSLDAVFSTALAKDRESRYRSGRFLADAARSALEGRMTEIPARATVLDGLFLQARIAERADSLPRKTDAAAAQARTSRRFPRVAVALAILAVLSYAVVTNPAVAGLVGLGSTHGSTLDTSNLASRVANAARERGWRTHIVGTGESVYGIASAEGVDRSALISANLPFYPNIAAETPPIGSTLLVPSTTTPPVVRRTATPVPTPTHPYAVSLRPEQVTMPQSEFPLPGYTITRDAAGNSPVAAKRWLRDFSSTTGQYWWANFIVTVYAPDVSASTAIGNTACAQIWDWSSSREQPVISEITAEVIGDGAKACRYAFPTIADVVSYTTGTRNVTVTTSVAVRTVGIAQAIATCVLLAKEQLGIIERLAPR